MLVVHHRQKPIAFFLFWCVYKIPLDGLYKFSYRENAAR
jgi:hypothetical protein